MLPWLASAGLITLGTVYPQALGLVGLTPKAKYNRLCFGSGTCTTGMPAPSNYVATAITQLGQTIGYTPVLTMSTL